MKKQKFIILAIVVFCLLLILYYRQQQRRYNLLRSHGIVTSARFVDFYQPTTAGQSGMRFIFYVDSKRYSGMTYCQLNEDYVDFVGKQISVLYQSDNPDNCTLLLTRHDYEIFQLPYPDSMKWTEQLLQ